MHGQTLLLNHTDGNLEPVRCGLCGTFAIAFGANDSRSLMVSAHELQGSVRTLGIRHELGDERFHAISIASLLISGSELPEAAQILGNAAAKLKARGPRGSQVNSLA